MLQSESRAFTVETGCMTGWMQGCSTRIRRNQIWISTCLKQIG